MATHDYVISNASGASVRADLNNALAAIVSNNSNATSPATTYAYQWWADTTTGQLKLRNSSNSAWITIFELDGTMLMEDGSVSAPGLAFASDLNTGFFRSAADKINFATGGAERLEIGSSEVVFNDPSNDVDFRVESNGNSHMLFVDAGNDRVGIGESSPGRNLVVNSGSSSGYIQLVNTNSGTAASNGFEIKLDSGGAIVDLINRENGAMRFFTNNTEQAQIDSSGNFGIGTTPAKKLDVKENSTGNVEQYLRNTTVNLLSKIVGTTEAQFGTETSHPLVFLTGNSEQARIDSAGRLLIGHSSSRSVDAQMFVQIEGTTQQGSSMSLVRNSNDAAPPNIVFGKSRGTSTGSNTVVQSGDDLGIISFNGADGTDLNTGAASIKAEVDGTPGSNDMPGRLVFSVTADSASSPSERMRISNTGNVKLTGGEALFWDDAGDRYIACIGDSTSNVNLHGRANVIFKTGGSSYDGGTEAARVDSSQRLLVGTSSGSGDIGVIVNKGGDARILLARVSQPSTSGGLGSLGWGRTNGEVGCTIGGVADGNWSSSSYPTSLRFSVAASGSTSVTERMRIKQNGQISTYCTGQYARVIESSRSAGTSDYLIFGRHSSGSITGSGGTQSFAVYTNGNVQNTNNSYGSLSDAKLKENIVDASSQWDDIKDIRVRNYNFIEGQTHTQIGVVAQEVETVSPGLVFDTPDLDEEGNDLGTVTKSVNYSVLYMKAVKALQEAMTRIETLETKVAALEAG